MGGSGDAVASAPGPPPLWARPSLFDDPDADLPLADDLRVVDGPGLAIAPDQTRDGSNVLSIPLGSGFEFHYGPGSFAAHCAEAERLGLEITVVDEPSLALDVDDPGDLAHLQVEGS